VRGVISDTPFLRGGLAALDDRASDRPFSVYDGLIGNADGLLDIIVPLSSRKLETYASCPFDFFMRHILSAELEDDVEEELDVEPRELGLLYHRVLARLFVTLVEKGLFASREANQKVIEGLVAAYVKKEVSGKLLGRIPALILRAREEHAALIVGRLVERERSLARSGFVPALYEVAFGGHADALPENPALTLTIGARPIPVVGRIDRIDINESEGAFSVVDYKRKKPSARRRLKTEIEHGRHFQMPIYLMAAESILFAGKRTPSGGALVYLETDDGADHRETLSREEYEETRDIVVEQIGEVVDEMQSGNFTPLRGDSCRFCGNRDLCRSDIKTIGNIRREKTIAAGQPGGNNDEG
jgi:ATP-dependent helicase/DNAse subunit B